VSCRSPIGTGVVVHAAALVLLGTASAAGQSELIAVEPSRRIDVGRGIIVALSYSARGDSVTVLTERGRVISADLRTGALGPEIRVGGKPAGLARSRDDAHLAVAAGREVTLIAPGTASRVVRVGDDVTAVAVSPTGAWVAAGTRTGVVVLIATATGEIASRLREGHTGAIAHVAFTGTGGETVLSVGADRNIVYWDVKRAERLRRITESEPVIVSATATPAGDLLFLGTESTGSKTTSGTEAGLAQAGASVLSGGTLAGAGGGMSRPGASSNRDMAYVNAVRAWGVTNAAPQKNFDLQGRAPIALGVAADCRYVGASVRSVRGSSLVVFDVERGAGVLDMPLAGRTGAVAFAPDGRTLVLGNDAGELLVYAVRGVQPRPRCVADLQGVKYAITGPRTPLVTPSRRIRFAVLDLDANNVEAGISRAIADQITTRLSLNPGIRLVERRRIAAIVQEQNFQQSGRTEAQGAVQLARILNVQKVLMGAVARLGTTMTIHVQMVDVETAAIDGAREVQCRACELEDLTQAVSELAATVVGDADSALNALPPPPEIEIDYPRGDVEVSGNSIVVRGTIRYSRPIEGFELLANGRPQDASRLLDRGGAKMTRLADGSGVIPFVQEVPLEQASNLIAVRAIGADGNDEQRYISVRRTDAASAGNAAPPPAAGRGAAPSTAAAAPIVQAPGISLEELLSAVRNRVPVARLTSLVGRYGIAFEPASAEPRLREAGVDASILATLRGARRVTPQD
jgi:WD40 repeat protein/TolB-like protein